MSPSEDKIYRRAYVFVYSNAKYNCRPINIVHVRPTTRDILVSSGFQYCGDKSVSIFLLAYDVSNNRSSRLKVSVSSWSLSTFKLNQISNMFDVHVSRSG